MSLVISVSYQTTKYKTLVREHRETPIIMVFTKSDIVNIRFVPKLKRTKTLVKRHRKLPLNMLLTKSVIVSVSDETIRRIVE